MFRISKRGSATVGMSLINIVHSYLIQGGDMALAVRYLSGSGLVKQEGNYFLL